MVGKSPHPSGSPIRVYITKGLSIPRVPYNEPLSPGLRKKYVDTTAIGFVHDIIEADRNEPEASFNNVSDKVVK
jgi:hypothetical protein